MSTTDIHAALNVPADITPLERLLLVLLARDAGPDGTAWPSVAQLAQSANVTPNAVRRSVQRLTLLGLVEKTRRRNANGVAASTLYHLTFDGSAAEVTEGMSA